MDFTVTGDEIVAEYKAQLAEANHQLMVMKVVYGKAQARLREHERQPDEEVPEPVVEHPKRPQVAQQVFPGANGAESARRPSQPA